MIRPKRVLLLSLKAGAGHIRAAEAIREALEASGEDCVVRHLEVLQYMTWIFRWSFSTIYGAMLRIAPSLWRIVYERTERQSVDSFSKRVWGAFNRLHAGRLMREVRDFDPDCIVCTHFIPAGLLATLRRRNQLSARLCVVITDYDLHAAWLHRGVDHYFVATEEIAHSIRAGEVDIAGVTAAGIPIVAAFRKEFPRREEMRMRLNLDPNRPVALLTGGGCGLGRLDEMAKLLAGEFPKVQLLTVAGNNKTLLAALEALARGNAGAIRPLGFVNNLHDYMAASDFVVTKPGGLTSSECLAMGLPMILIDPVPGQEERNANYLLENGVAQNAKHAPSLIYKVECLFADSVKQETMRRRAKLIAKPMAAQSIANEIFSHDNARAFCQETATTQPAAV